MAQSRPRKPKRKKISLLDLFPDYRTTAFRARAEGLNDAALRQVAAAYKSKGIVLYVGAGVSRSVGLPGWVDLMRSLTVRMMTQKVHAAVDQLGKLSENQRWDLISSLYGELDKIESTNKPILVLARALKNQLGDSLVPEISRILYRSRSIRRLIHGQGTGKDAYRVEWMRRRWEPEGTWQLLEQLAALARSERDVKGVQGIINYNYDDILEEFLRSQNIRCQTVLSGNEQVPDGVLPSYHVHGLVSLNYYESQFRGGRRVKTPPLGNFVFSEDEYHAEYADPYRWSNMVQISQMGQRTGLFVGLSMEDPNIRRLLEVTHRQYPETKNYAILPRRRPLSGRKDNKQGVLDNLFEDVETGSFEQIGVRVVWVDSYAGVPATIRRILDLAGT